MLKAQPQGKIRLTASYNNSDEQKRITGYMNTIVNMFAKIGVNPKTQIEQQISRSVYLRNPVQQNAPAAKTVNIHVTGINLNEYQQKAAKKA